MKTYLKNLSEKLFNTLKANEELGLFLHSEESTFIRFNASKVRQNTTVNQHELTLHYQANKRLIKMTFSLTMMPEHDLEKGLGLLADARLQLPHTDENPQFVPLQNNGSSESFKKIQRPADAAIPALIHRHFSDVDFAGFWCSGPLRQASVNSKGQFHYFETDYFFLDYSLYNGPKAAKGFYSATQWDEKDFEAQARMTKNKLNLLNRPTVTVSRGQHRVYLEPMAVAEIVGTMSWGGFSQSAFNQGRAPLKKLQQKELLLSPKFSFGENLALGYSPLFNSQGEISTPHIPLIENGELKSLLISSATAQEYKLSSNQAAGDEAPRSPEIRAGALNKDDVLKKLDTGLYLSNLHYINWSDMQSGRMTGMTRFACFWVQNGEIQGPIQDLRFDETIYNIFGSNLLELTQQQEIFVNSMTYLKRYLGAMKVPGALIKDFNFTL